MASDSAGVFAILGDPRTVEHNPSDRLEDRREAADLVARWVQHWEEHGFGYWCVREAGSDRIIGYAGVKRVRIHGHPVLDLVYRCAPEVWGRGHGTEATAFPRSPEKPAKPPLVSGVEPGLSEASVYCVVARSGGQRGLTVVRTRV